MSTGRRAYVACLASYNAGILYGRWVDLDGSDPDEVREQIGDILAGSPSPGAEEWAIHDYDGVPSWFGEHPDLDKLLAYVEAVEEHGTPFEVYVAEHLGYHQLDENTVDSFRESYRGSYNREDDYAYEWLEEFCSSWPEEARRYFDAEAWMRCFCGSVIYRDGEYHVFESV
jgi:antirestriction protein